MSRWLSLELTLAEEAAELAGDLLLELGATGYELQDQETFSRSGEATVRLLAYLPEEAGPPERLQQQILGLLPARLREAELTGTVHGLRVEAVSDPGWSEAWKRFFRLIPVGQRLLIRPPWEPRPTDGQRAVLTLDPGLAFGTGTHPSTRLCLEVIESLPPQSVVLDVGCGSGILAIAAVLLGTPRAEGIDVDPEAVTVARENAEKNDVAAAIEFSTTPVQDLASRYPLVLANILSHTLLELAPALIARLAPAGTLVLAGLLAREADGVAAAFVAQGLTFVRRLDGVDDGGEAWAALVLRESGGDAAGAGR